MRTLTGWRSSDLPQIHRDFTEMIAASTSSLSPKQLEDFTTALRVVAQEVRTRIQL